MISRIILPEKQGQAVEFAARRENKTREFIEVR